MQRSSPKLQHARVWARITAVLAILAGLGLLQPGADAQEPDGHRRISVLTLDGVINPTAAEYVSSSISDAQDAGAHAVVLQLDTPGGLDGAMRDIVQAIDRATVPVIVYVSPSGGRAASAGAFVTMASALAAMAPGTTIGSATPISMSPGGQAQDMPEALRNKVINDAASYIAAHAELHGRNAEWAERAVREGASLNAQEAVKQNVVEMTATDLDDLLEQAHGAVVNLATGDEVVLDTREALVTQDDMTMGERVLAALGTPNMAFILLGLGALGILAELSNPGMILPGVLGGVALLIGLYALGTLDAYWGGIVLIAIGLALFAADIFTAANGLLSGAGVLSLALGGLMLFRDTPGVEVSPWSIAAVAVPGLAFTVIVARAVAKSRGQDMEPMAYGTLVGAEGVARSNLDPDGMVFVNGERWKARSTTGPVSEGERVRVESAEGFTLRVKKKEGD